jgi:tRNA(Ile)-lysidine synthase
VLSNEAHRSMSISTQLLLRQLAVLPPTNRYLLAYSGGMDSTVLLHLLAACRESIDAAVEALHVDHGLHSDSFAWRRHCSDTCRRLQIPLQATVVTLQRLSGESREAQAREARYAAMRKLMRPGDVLLTAHHRDDQAETLLLNLMRGSGVRGLAAMPPLRRLGEGWLARPLLATPRAAVEAYAAEHELQWIDDPSNVLTDYNRNYLRHEILPRLTQRWPAAAASIADSASHLADAAELLQQESDELLLKMVAAPGRLRLQPLLQQPRIWRELLLRRWLCVLELPPPPRRQLAEFVAQLTADARRIPLISWSGVELRRYHGMLYAEKSMPEVDATLEITWTTDQPLSLPSQLGRLSMIEGPPRRFMVRFRRAGDVMRWRGHRRTLKWLFQHLGVPPWRRGRVPLLVDRGEVVAIADCAYADNMALRLQWQCDEL